MEYTNMLAEYNDILKPEDVQKILRTGRNTVYNYLKDGTIKSIMIGGTLQDPETLSSGIHVSGHEFCKGGYLIMARPKKNGRRATGIQGKSGYLYIITHNHIIKDGVKTREKVWIATGLKDTPENVKKASDMKNKLNNKREVSITDRNVTFAEYTDMFLSKKKREVSETT